MLLFKERFKAPILAGAKTITRRGMLRTFKVGSVHQAYTRPPWCKPAGEPFARLKLLDVRVVRLGDMTEDEARREGFGSLADFWAYFEEQGRSVDESSEMRRIEFELA